MSRSLSKSVEPDQQLAQQINVEHHAVEAAAGTALAHALQAGRLLAEAKAKCNHGDWAEWLAQHFEGSPRTARSYLLLAKRWPAIESKMATPVANLAYRDALRLIATPKPVRLPNLEALAAGQPFWAIGNDDDLAELRPLADHPGYAHFSRYTGLSTGAGEELYTRRGVIINRDAMLCVMAVYEFTPVGQWHEGSVGADTEVTPNK